jgi:diguanylate cyclase (GGDEF)-like protein/PAS domain S-box-containing protein
MGKTKDDILQEMLGGRVVGGTLSQLANYSDLFQKMSESVFLIDRHSLRVLECNPAACVLLNKMEVEILGQEFPTLMGDQKGFEAALKQFQKKTDHQVKGEIEFKADHGETMYFDIAATTLKILDYVEVIQFIARDVTAMKRAQHEMQEMNEVLKNLSTTDAMTGLRNYRYFKEALASVHHQAEGFKGQYGIIFLDVDHFKKFNDRNGHPAGDEVLRGVGKILKETVRAKDLACRYGGEEFVVLCRNSTMEETREMAETIRAKIQATTFPFGEFQPLGFVSTSIGVSGYPACGNTFEEVLEHSDQALYVSKEGGRNRVTAYTDLTADQKIKKAA